MSGGVDSSVAAALLVEQGYQVIGLMLQLWNEPGSEADNRCCTPDAMAQARRVAAILGIPFYAIDARDVFYDNVVQPFIDGYAHGLTPNPCLTCNRLVRWGFLRQHALALGALALATGHYARIQNNAQGEFSLLRAVDRSKDQSYVLHTLTQAQLAQARFPLGDYTKAEVRHLARTYHLPVAERPDSQDLCFLGQSNYRDFLRRFAPQVNQPGPIINRAGEVLGRHAGLAFYTIGQRKGLGINRAFPLYVLDKDPASNALVIGAESELGQNELLAKQVNWIASQPPASPFRAQVKIRYKAQPAWATITPSPASREAHVLFDDPQRDITPGQAAVFYDAENCLGGGIIQFNAIDRSFP